MRCQESNDDHPDVDVRQEDVTVRLIRVTDDYYGLTERHVELARQISAVGRTLGIPADASAVRTVQVTIDALAGPEVVAFWRALLDYQDRYQDRANSGEDPIDPRRRGAPFSFQQMDAPRPQRNRVHVDVWVPYDQAEARIAAALAAGGRLVNDADAPSNWVLANHEGNEACVGVAGAPASHRPSVNAPARPHHVAAPAQGTVRARFGLGDVTHGRQPGPQPLHGIGRCLLRKAWRLLERMPRRRESGGGQQQVFSV